MAGWESLCSGLIWVLLFILVLDSVSGSLFGLDLLLSRLCLGLFCLSFVLVLETISGSRPKSLVLVLRAPWQGVYTVVLDPLKAPELLWVFVLSRPWMLRVEDLPLLVLATLALLALDPHGAPGPGKGRPRACSKAGD